MMLLLACTEPDEGQSLSAAPGDTSHADGDADTDSDSDSDTGTPPDDGELRGVWVDRWTYASEDDVRSIMAGAAAAGFNAVYFQVRGTADAYYQSSYEPWSSRLSGTLGVDPGWDPLGVAVESGHALGMEVHAYINAFPFWSGTTPPAESSPRHAYLEHPEWLVADESGEPMALNSSYVWMSPGNPEVRQRLADVSRDIADRYDVDGIHVDLVRYPGRDYSFDEVSLSLWDGTDYADWQRARVVEAVLGVQEAVDVPVTASVWGIYEDRWGWGTSQGYHDYYQDSYAFLETGATDANMPMIYWPVAENEGDYTDFTTLVKEFVANRHDRHIYAGVAADLTLDEMLACIESARANGAQGVVIFDYGLLDDNGYLDDLAAGPFAEPKEPPRMDWR
ncbi:MAG: family 10 glycosylhydrolase [Deltaproteobacteria bacterium]|nr:family 10 glycosylhydrolase [Deltaproteobacteria bacterium]